MEQIGEAEQWFGRVVGRSCLVETTGVIVAAVLEEGEQIAKLLDANQIGEGHQENVARNVETMRPETAQRLAVSVGGGGETLMICQEGSG